MKTIAYVRTSTTDQNISIDAQRAKIEAMATMRDLTIDEVIAEQESAKTLDRPGMARLLALVEAGEVGTILIAKLDRLTRSVRDLSDLMDLFNRHKVALVSVAEMIDTSSAVGRMIVNIIATISQWEVETIQERTVAAMAHQKKTGKVYCQITPYGYERIGGDGTKGNKGTLVPVESEQVTVRRIFAWSAAGVSLLAISRKLNGMRIPTKSGGNWHASTVRAILKNSLHAATPVSAVIADVQSALQNLGCPRQEALELTADLDPTADLDSALRAALARREAQRQAA